MKGLLRKDIYITLKSFRAYFLLTLVFSLLSVYSVENFFFLVYPCLLMGLLPMSIQSMDEGAKWDVFLGTLPCSKAQAVSEKYLLGLIFHGITALFLVLIQAVGQLLSGSLSLSFLAFQLYLMVLTALLPAALSLPLIFKLGAEKGQLARFLVIGIVCAGGAAISYISMDLFSFGSGDFAVPLGSLLIWIFVGVAVLYILSWLLSIRFYEKREIS